MCKEMKKVMVNGFHDVTCVCNDCIELTLTSGDKVLSVGNQEMVSVQHECASCVSESKVVKDFHLVSCTCSDCIDLTFYSGGTVVSYE